MSATLAQPGLRPPVVVRPVPACEPPFDDELPAPVAWMPGFEQLALRWPAAGPAAGPAVGTVGAARAAGVVGAAGTVEAAGAMGAAGGDGEDADRGAGSDRRASPPAAGPGGADDAAGARAAAGRFVTRCLEILNGFRPVDHARPLVGRAQERAVLAQLAIGRQRVADLGGGSARAGAAGPRRRSRPGGPLPVTLARLRAGGPAPGVLEAVAVLRTADRAWAFAFRLERQHDGWRCTAAWAL